ncbi:MAG: hypothetical protein ACLQAT_08300 [Candidatus Binataceae bacterium]
MRARTPHGRNKFVPPEILGVDHIYLSVTDFERSQAFYDRLMKTLGFKKGTHAIGGAPHRHYYKRNMQVSIRPPPRRRCAARFLCSGIASPLCACGRQCGRG